MNSVIAVSNLRKQYALYKCKGDKLKEALSFRRKYHKEFEALKGISFEIEKGECVGIIGLNGSGKSTLLKLLAGIIRPTSGSIVISGKVAALLELGAGFNPEYTGLENIYLNTLLMGMSRSETEDKLQEIIEFADIGDFIYQPVKSYSSGMFVRLAFAIAIAVEPDILIIDEALSVGDVFFQQKCFNKIREFSEKSTVVIVSHDLNAITKFCKRVMVINEGTLIYDGNSRVAVTEYYKIKQGNASNENPNNQVDENSSKINREKFRKPAIECYSGKMDAKIESYYYQIDEIAFGEYCEYGKKITVQMIIHSNKKIESAIVGYQIRDKFGNEIFGETSMTSGNCDVCIEPGESVISFGFIWPEVREGDYFITLGLGEGYEVLKQVEQCWINQVIHIVNTTHGKLIYGIFNNQMKEFRIDRSN